LMSLGLAKGSELTIVATGADESVAVDSLAKLVSNRFVTE
jgi:phosphotransferase system HPr-like phosphotransfer protein